jgi:hypothetical protein
MARKRKKIALYEVIGKADVKPHYEKLSGQPPPQKSDDHKSDTADLTATSLGKTTRWPTKPKMLFFSAGRVEISLPYQIAVVILLVFVLLILVAFRLGQNLSSKVVPIPVTAPNSTQKLAEPPFVHLPEKAEPVPKEPAPAEPVKNVPPAVQKPVVQKLMVVDTKNNNRIVIQTWRVKEQLEPVKEYFTKCGIETEIINDGDWYYLVTKKKYDNPDKLGTTGYAERQKIIELGAKYEPPQGSASFGPQPFHDAYGKRFNE